MASKPKLEEIDKRKEVKPRLVPIGPPERRAESYSAWGLTMDIEVHTTDAGHINAQRGDILVGSDRGVHLICAEYEVRAIVVQVGDNKVVVVPPQPKPKK